MAPTLKLHKVVAALPGVLEADSVYFVRVGTGFTMYVTNGSGTIVAYTPNLGWADLQGKPTTLAGYGVTDAYTSLAVQSRGMNLVTNGTGLMGNNYNFSRMAFTQSELYTGRGSFKIAGRNAVITTDEFIPVIPDLYYQYRFAIKSTVLDAPYNYAYGMVVCYDVAGNDIQPLHYTRYNTVTTLAQPLKPGDTVIYLTSAANWASGTPANRVVRIEQYRNPYGYLWPAGTYSRNVSVYNPFDNAAVDLTANTVTLKAPWSVGNPDAADQAWPAGTPIVTGFSGGTYQYPTNLNNFQVPGTWTVGQGIIGGVRTDGNIAVTQFVPGTALVRVGWLLNRNNGGVTHPGINETALSGVYFSEITPQTLTGGLVGYSGSFKDQAGRTVTVTNGLITSVV